MGKVEAEEFEFWDDEEVTAVESPEALSEANQQNLPKKRSGEWVLNLPEKSA